MGAKAFIPVGNLVSDAEIHGNMCTFTVAANDRERGEDGEWRDAPSFIDCKVLGSRGVKLAPYLKKGTKVSVFGSLRQERWESKDGQRRSTFRVIVDEIGIMSCAESRPAPRPTQDAYADDEIPF